MLYFITLALPSPALFADNLPPTITCPPGSPFFRSTEPSKCYYTVQGDEFNATATDDAPGYTLYNDFNNSSTLANAQFPKGTTQVTWTVTDAGGLTASCSVTINVVDNQPPVISCPSGSPYTKNTAPGKCYYLSQAGEFTPNYSDNCPGTTIINDFNNSGTLTGAQLPKGTTVITWTATDASGLTSVCSVTITVNDNQAPVITCPANVNASNITDLCYASVTTANPIVSDNCEVTALTWTMTGATTGNSPATGINYIGTYTLNVGVTTVSYTVYDQANNSRTCSFTVTVRDTQSPRLHGIPANTSIVCEIVPPPPPIGSVIYATDNCDPDVEITFSETSTQEYNNTCASVIYEVTRKWVASDIHGNSDTAYQIISVVCECCTNGIDDDGNGLVDEDDPTCPCSAPEYRLDCNSNLIYVVPPVWQMNPNYNNDPNLYTNPSSLVISSPFGTSHINVRTGDGTTFNHDYTVVNGTPLTIPLNYSLVQTPNYNVAELSRGLIIETDQLIQVLYRLTANNNQLLVTIQGEQAYGMRFRAGSQTNVCGLPNTQKRENHFISVMALSNNTLVDFDFTVKMKGLPFHHSVTLNAFQTYVVIDNDSNKSITGSLITANKDIAVISGSQHSQQCTGGSGRDGAADQLVPSCVAGTDYIVFKGTDDNNPSPANYAVITAIASNTQVFIDGGATPVDTLLPGQYYTYNMPGQDFSNHYIHTNQPAYCYQFGSVQANGEIGMASVPPIHGCNGDKYIEFFKFPNATINNVTISIPFSGLSSLTLNGNPYTNYATAKTIPGFPDWRTVTFNNSNLNDFNIVQSDISFHAAQFIGKVDAGAFGYLTSFKDKITVMHPVTGQPAVEYFVDTVCGGQRLNHCILSTSCSGGHYISDVVQSPNTGGIEVFPNSTCFNYIGKTGFTGIDSITVMVSDQLGFTQPVCLTYYVCGSPPQFTNFSDTVHWCVQDIVAAIWDGACDFTPIRPDWHTMYAGDTSLDIDMSSFSDDCTPPEELILHWKITLVGGTIITGTGQVSTYGSNIQFPLGDNTITYWLEDQCGNLTPLADRPVVIVRVFPRPEITKSF